MTVSQVLRAARAAYAFAPAAAATACSGSSSSTAHAACSVMLVAPSMATNPSANRWRTAWKDPIVDPYWRRSAAYAVPRCRTPPHDAAEVRCGQREPQGSPTLALSDTKYSDSPHGFAARTGAPRQIDTRTDRTQRISTPAAANLSLLPYTQCQLGTRGIRGHRMAQLPQIRGECDRFGRRRFAAYEAAKIGSQRRPEEGVGQPATQLFRDEGDLDRSRPRSAVQRPTREGRAIRSPGGRHPALSALVIAEVCGGPRTQSGDQASSGITQNVLLRGQSDVHGSETGDGVVRRRGDTPRTREYPVFETDLEFMFQDRRGLTDGRPPDRSGREALRPSRAASSAH